MQVSHHLLRDLNLNKFVLAANVTGLYSGVHTVVSTVWTMVGDPTDNKSRADVDWGGQHDLNDVASRSATFLVSFSSSPAALHLRKIKHERLYNGDFAFATLAAND